MNADPSVFDCQDRITLRSLESGCPPDRLRSAHPFSGVFHQEPDRTRNRGPAWAIDDDSTSKAKWMDRKSKLCEDGMSDDEIAGNFNAGYHFLSK